MSDDDGEFVPEVVTNYYFVDGDESAVSFDVLPVYHSNDADKTSGCKKDVFLRGNSADGLEKVYKQVIGWKFILGREKPEISVLSKSDGRWIGLLKPRKSYQNVIRRITITLEMIHFVRKNPESSGRKLWDHLHAVFNIFDIGPSEDDFRDHYSLIEHLSSKDEVLSKSQLFWQILEGGCRKRSKQEKLCSTVERQPFIAEDDELDDAENDMFDSVCAICDNGGAILCCEGVCLRSFHATPDCDDSCESLGMSRRDVKEIPIFQCKNCVHNKHQCFACGQLGSSDRSNAPEVFQCVNATCGHFYHPRCVAELFFPDNQEKMSEYSKKVASGESFTCPVHRCSVCNKLENKDEKDLQFAICRRCPISYHRKCMPSEISFEEPNESDDEINESEIMQRAWDNLLPKRILIYCLKHEIDKELRTPIRNHLKFPGTPEEKKHMDSKKRVELLVKKRRLARSTLPPDLSVKPMKKIKQCEVHLVSTMHTSPDEVSVKRKKLKSPKKSLPSESRRNEDSIREVISKVTNEGGKTSKSYLSTSPIGGIVSSSFPRFGGDMEKRMSAFAEEMTSSLTKEDIMRKLVIPSTHTYYKGQGDITRGKIERSLEAVKEALQQLEKGVSIEDATTVCAPEVVKQLARWHNKLKVYISPFLHGVRYTSFGRHFTKLEKLKEVVDRIRWYVKDGDTIVDFCCGSNDFSWLMKEKLDEAGKNCTFKNYDLIRPKNDFCFEKKDWMKVQPKELSPGSQLIMGLNPPFGLKGALANKFIDRALQFKPKLIILIVPKGTERLDQKRQPYDLIWEDLSILSGKSFYVPGSTDDTEKHAESWNWTAPGLYLWSHPDFTQLHRSIAMKHGHCVSHDTSPRDACGVDLMARNCYFEKHAVVDSEDKTMKEISREKISYESEITSQDMMYMRSSGVPPSGLVRGDQLKGNEQIVKGVMTNGLQNKNETTDGKSGCRRGEDTMVVEEEKKTENLPEKEKHVEDTARMCSKNKRRFLEEAPAPKSKSSKRRISPELSEVPSEQKVASDMSISSNSLKDTRTGNVDRMSREASQASVTTLDADNYRDYRHTASGERVNQYGSHLKSNVEESGEIYRSHPRLNMEASADIDYSTGHFSSEASMEVNHFGSHPRSNIKKSGEIYRGREYLTSRLAGEMNTASLERVHQFGSHLRSNMEESGDFCGSREYGTSCHPTEAHAASLERVHSQFGSRPRSNMGGSGDIYERPGSGFTVSNLCSPGTVGIAERYTRPLPPQYHLYNRREDTYNWPVGEETLYHRSDRGTESSYNNTYYETQDLEDPQHHMYFSEQYNAQTQPSYYGRPLPSSPTFGQDYAGYEEGETLGLAGVGMGDERDVASEFVGSSRRQRWSNRSGWDWRGQGRDRRARGCGHRGRGSGRGNCYRD